VQTWVSVAALGVALAALVGAFLAMRTLARLRRSASLLGRGGYRGESFLEATARQVAATTALREEVTGWRTLLVEERAELAGQLAEARALLAGTAAEQQAAVETAITRFATTSDQALSRVAIVRFDAFPDLAGRLSFSVALLDSAGNGITLTSIAGRAETRVYAKPIAAGSGEVELSEEERRAVAAARKG
jgi:hypothetical protein